MKVSELEKLNKIADDSLSITYYYNHWSLRSYKNDSPFFHAEIEAETLDGCIHKAKNVIKKNIK